MRKVCAIWNSMHKWLHCVIIVQIKDAVFVLLWYSNSWSVYSNTILIQVNSNLTMTTIFEQSTEDGIEMFKTI